MAGKWDPVLLCAPNFIAGIPPSVSAGDLPEVADGLVDYVYELALSS